MRLLVLALAFSALTSASVAASAPSIQPGTIYSSTPQSEIIVPGRPARDMPVINPNGPAAAICPPTSRYEAARRGGKLRMQKLNELPAADMYSAVYRRVGGCEAPIIVRYNVGGATQNGR